MKQTKVESAIESTANIATGFVISWCVWMFVVTPLIQAGYLQAGPAHDAFYITSIFTVTSWLRSYFWRRYFNAGMHKVAHQWAKRLTKTTKKEHINDWPTRE